MEPTTLQMGLIYSAFLYASAVPMPPSRPLGIVLDSKFLGARSLSINARQWEGKRGQMPRPCIAPD